MKNYLIHNITYDLGSEWNGFSKPKLPNEITLEDVPDGISQNPIELEDFIANFIFNSTGQFAETFMFKIEN